MALVRVTKMKLMIFLQIRLKEALIIENLFNELQEIYNYYYGSGQPKKKSDSARHYQVTVHCLFSAPSTNQQYLCFLYALLSRLPLFFSLVFLLVDFWY